MKKNVGNLDRIIRLVIAAVLGYLVYSGKFNIHEMSGIIATVAAVIMAFTALTGWCAIYSLFGSSTCSTK